MQKYTFSQCVALLKTDPKIFRKWVREDLGLGEKDQVSRADSRVRYLTREQIEQLAALHDRQLPADEHLKDEPETSSPGAYKLQLDRLDAAERSIAHLEREIFAATADLDKTVLRVELVEHHLEAVPQIKSDVHTLMEQMTEVQEQLQVKLGPTSLEDLAQRITELEARPQAHVEQEQQTVETRIAELEASYQGRIAELEAQLAQYQRQEKATPSPKKKSIKKKRSQIKRLPTTLAARNAFSLLHNVPDKVVSKASIAGKIATTKGKWLYNDHVILQALSDRGKHDFYTVFHQRSDFKQCSECPHKLTTTSE